MEGKPPTATYSKVAQHTLTVFEAEGVTFSSQFDSGNLGKVEYTGNDCYWLWTVPDCAGSQVESSCRSWFHFQVSVSRPRLLSFTVKNLNLQGKMYREGMKPVVRTAISNWERVPGSVAYAVAGEVATLFEITFTYDFRDPQATFAFTYPWSCDDNDQFLTQLESQVPGGVLFHRTTLVMSLEGRKCEVLTVTSEQSMENCEEIPYSRPMFPCGSPMRILQSEKQYVFLSARVHPGEAPASYMLNGFLQWILSSDPRAVASRHRFVYVIVPMLNPDGVYRGHYRLDTRGSNLNRCYSSPDPAHSPTIWAVKELIMTLRSLTRDKFHAYVDLHAHASKRGVFVYGNSMDFWRTVSAHSFARLLSLNSPYFDHIGCIFDEESMKAKEPRDKNTKEGSGRVAVYMATGLPLCFTLEANFNSGAVAQITASGMVEDAREEGKAVGNSLFDIGIFESVGKALGISMLDSVDGNEFSRVLKSGFRNFSALRLSCADSLAATAAYRGDFELRKQLRAGQLEPHSSKSRPTIGFRPPKPRILRRSSHSKTPSFDPSKEYGAKGLKTASNRDVKRLSADTQKGVLATPCRRKGDRSFRSSRNCSNDHSDQPPLFPYISD